MGLPAVRRQHGTQRDEGGGLGNGNLGPNFSAATAGLVALGKAYYSPGLPGSVCTMECRGDGESGSTCHHACGCS